MGELSPHTDAEARSNGKCGWTKTDTGDPCQWPEGRGLNRDTGLCSLHATQGAPEGNTNASSHGTYMEEVEFYSTYLPENGYGPLQQLVDDIYADYYADFVDLHGDIRKGEDVELFRLAVAHVKDIVLDNWSEGRPDSLAESGNPLVDRETHVSETGTEYYRYKESVVIAAQQKLSRDRQRWLKTYGLDRSGESDTAANLGGAMMEALQDAYRGDSTDE